MLPALSAIALITVSIAQGQQYSFEIIQFPGAPITSPTAINNRGQIAGIVQGLGTNMGFFKDGPVFSLISVPGAGEMNGTVANGINDNAQVVGSYTIETTSVHSHGFLKTGQTITSFDVPGASDTQPSDINNLGQIVGRFFPVQGLQIGRAFIQDGTNFTTFQAPGAQDPAGTTPYGMNDRGQIVGEFLDSTGFHSFLFESNQFSLLNVPGSTDTHVFGINNSGQMAGYFSDHGFVTIGGRFYRLDVPGVTTTIGTRVFGINDAGQVVGNVHVSGVPGVSVLGFVATPCTGTGTNCITLPEILPPPIERRDLAPVAFDFPAAVIGPPYASVTIVWGCTNLGTEAATNYWSDSLHVSPNPVFDYGTSTEVARHNHYGTLAPGESYRQTNTFRLPLADSGVYYFHLQVDTFQEVPERDETNNILSVPFTFNSRPPDLAPVALQTSGTVTAPPYPRIPVVWGVTNQGLSEALGNAGWSDIISLSTNLNGANATVLYAAYETGPIAAGGSYWRTNTLSLPVVRSGTYYLVFRTDENNNLRESNLNNNGLIIPLTINITPADLAPVVLQLPGILNGPPRPELTLIYGTTNQGSGAARSISYDGSWYDGIFVSTNAFLDPAARWVQWDDVAGPLEPGTVFLRTNTVRLPIIESGSYFLLFLMDKDGSVYESNEDNNTLAVPFSFNAQPPDLVPVALQASQALTALPYPTINITWGVRNQGLGQALAKFYPDYLWPDQLFLSTSNSPDGGIFLNSYGETGPIAPGESYWRTNSVQLPVTQSGLYYLVFKTDANNTLLEATTANNTLIVPISITVTPPDLAPILFRVPSSVTAPPYPTITFACGVTNQGSGAATPTWSDELFISNQPVFDQSATSLGSFSEYNLVPPGSAYWRTNNVTVPVTSSGTYYLFFVADASDSLHDGARSNNIAAAQVSFNLQPADLAPSAFVLPAVVSSFPNPKLLFSWTVTNIGSGNALRQWPDEVYFSTKSNLDWSAQTLLTTYESGPVSPGASYQRSRSATVPVTQSGQYYFFFKTDTDNSLHEANTANNTVAVPVTFHIDTPDLAPILFQAPAVIADSPNPIVTLTYAVTNQGAGDAVGLDYPYIWRDQLFVSTNSVLDGSAIPIEGYYSGRETGPVAAGNAYWRTRKVQIPVRASGDYFLLLNVNADKTLFETAFTNNLLAVPVKIDLQLPDLAPVGLVAPTSVTGPPYPAVTLAWGITNRGPGEAGRFSTWPYGWADAVYLSTNINLDWPGARVTSLLDHRPLSPGTSYWHTNTVILPVTNSGDFYLILRTDDESYLPETDESNNVLVAPVRFRATGLPDLAPLALQAPPLLTNYALVTVVTAVTNEGAGTAQAVQQNNWQDRIFISRIPALDSTARLVTVVYESGPVPPGGDYWRTNTFSVTELVEGDYFFIFQINGDQALAESNPGNNTLVIPFSFRPVPPDLTPVALQASPVVDDSAYPSMTVIWGVTNQGPGLAAPTWWAWIDNLYVSTNASTTGVFAYALSLYENNLLPAGGTYWRTNTIQLPVATSGTYYLVFETDTANDLRETNVVNNVAAVPVTFQIRPPDLAPLLAQVPAEVVGPGNPLVDLVWAVTNRGTGTAQTYSSGWEDMWYISTNNVLDGSAIGFLYDYQTNSVAAGGVYWRSNTIRLPVIETGTYYLFLVANNNNYLAESDDSNNVLVKRVNVTIQPPDLAPLAFVVPDTITGGPWPSVTVIVGVTNRGIGTAPAGQGWRDNLYISAYPFLDEYSYPFFSLEPTNALSPGSVYWVTNNVRLPVVDSARMYLIFKADGSDQVFETDESNNSIVSAITLDLSPTPNLVPLELRAPPEVTSVSNAIVTISWRVANQGPGPTTGQWVDTIYLSYFPHLDWGSQMLSSSVITNSLTPGADYWCTNSFTLQGVYQGTYFFILSANSDGGVFETAPGDNVLSVPVQLDLPAPPSGPIISGANLLTNGAVQLAVYGAIGSQYSLQASTNLLTWVPVTNFIMIGSPTYVVDPQANSFQQRFYRLAMVLPPVLNIARTANNSAVISWPLSADGWILEQSSSRAAAPQSWAQIPPPYQTNATHAWITVTNSENISFYRLRMP